MELTLNVSTKFSTQFVFYSIFTSVMYAVTRY